VTVAQDSVRVGLNSVVLTKFKSKQA